MEALVEGSYAGAKEKVAEQKAERVRRARMRSGKEEAEGGREEVRSRACVVGRASREPPASRARAPAPLYRIFIAWLLSAATPFAAWVLPGVAIEGVRVRSVAPR